MNSLSVLVLVVLALMLSTPVLAAPASLRGYAYIPVEDDLYIYVSNMTVTVNDTITNYTNETGFYDFGFIFIEGDKEIRGYKYGYVPTFTIINVTGDCEYNLSTGPNVLVQEPIIPYRGERVELSSIILVLSLLSAIFLIKRRNE